MVGNRIHHHTGNSHIAFSADYPLSSTSKLDAGLFQGGMVPEEDLLKSDEAHEPELNLLQSGPPSPIILSPNSPSPHGW